MSYLKRAQEELHISDAALNRIMDVLDEVRETIDSGGEYTPRSLSEKCWRLSLVTQLILQGPVMITTRFKI